MKEEPGTIWQIFRIVNGTENELELDGEGLCFELDSEGLCF